MLQKCIMFRLRIVKPVVRFGTQMNATRITGRSLPHFEPGVSPMNKPIQSVVYLLLFLSMAVMTTGCSTTSCSKWSPKNMWENRPRPFQSLFRGAPCSSCNPPAGKLFGFGSNTATGCEDGSCGGSVMQGQQPIYQDGAVPYYPSEYPSQLQQPMNGGQIINAPGPDMSVAPIQTNYPPTNDFYSDSQFGSGLNSGPGFETNAEAITPPMYGSRNILN